MTQSRSQVMALVAISMAAMACQAQDRYTVTDLGMLSGTSTVMHKLNSSAHMAGTTGMRDGGGSRAALWQDTGSGLRSLAVPRETDYSEATAINNRDESVGTFNTNNTMRAVIWSSTGVMKELGTLPGDTSSRAFGINDQGKVVGLSSGPRGVRSFVWSARDGMAHVGMPAGTKSSEAHGINNRGEIVGDFVRGSESHAYLWTSRGGVTDLGVLSGGNRSRATAINDAGQVVGSSSGEFGTRSFLWTSSEGMQPINDLPPTDFSEAIDINARGQLVGTYESSLGNHAYVWSKKGGYADLNSVVPQGRGLVLTVAVAINDRGQILALGMSHPTLSVDHNVDLDEQDDLHGVDVHAFLLTPVGGVPRQPQP